MLESRPNEQGALLRRAAPASASATADTSGDAAPAAAPVPLWASLGFVASDEPDEVAAASAQTDPPPAEPISAAPATALGSLLDVDLTGASLAAARVRSALARSRR